MVFAVSSEIKIRHITASAAISRSWGLLVKILLIRVELNTANLVSLVITEISRFACKLLTKLSVPECIPYLNRPMFQRPAIRQSCLELETIDIIDSKEDMNISIQLPGVRYTAPYRFFYQS